MTFGAEYRNRDGERTIQNTGPQDSQLRWSAEDKAYEIMVPEHGEGTLELTFPGDNPHAFHAIDGDGSKLPLSFSVYPSNIYGEKFEYSGVVFYQTHPEGATDGFIHGVFAFAVPTAAGDVPTSGGAIYNGELHGFASNGYDVVGDVQMAFDFAAGVLSGHMLPKLYSDWDGVDRPLGTYTFRDTVFSAGSTTFSGAFVTPNAAGESGFSGRFAGPGAAEVIANWHAPFTDTVDGSSGTIRGFWAAKGP